jgi:hypothetical protein
LIGAYGLYSDIINTPFWHIEILVHMFKFQNQTLCLRLTALYITPAF